MLDFGTVRNGPSPSGKSVDGPELRSVLKDLEIELQEGPEGGFFMGAELGRADIMIGISYEYDQA